MKTEITKTEYVHLKQLPDGQYIGRWNGYEIEIQCIEPDQFWRLKTSEGILGESFVKIIVDAVGKIDVIEFNTAESAHAKSIVETLDIVKSGHAGVDKTGRIVDRRTNPLAVPIQKNPFLGVPKPR